MKAKIKQVNIETGMPTADVAEKRVQFEIMTAKREGVSVLKIIHGYGSSGVGGKLKDTVTRLLSDKKREGTVKAYINGGQWDIFNPETRSILDACEDLRRDTELGNQNQGITFVLL